MTIAARAAALLSLLPGLAFGAVGASSTPDRLVDRLHALDERGVEAGILAQRRGESDAVRRYGRVLERDRRLADGRVLGLARSQGLRVSARGPDVEGRAMLQRLEGVPESQFDREFLAAMTAAHDKELAQLREARLLTRDRRLAALVDRLLPVFDQDRQLAARLGVRARRG